MSEFIIIRIHNAIFIYKKLVSTRFRTSSINFGSTQGTNIVSFGATQAAVTGWSNTSITATVPAGVTGAMNIIVSVNGFPFYSPSQFTVTPRLIPIISNPASLAFGSVSVGSSLQKTLAIGNTGNTTLTGTLSVPANSGFALNAAALSVAAGSTQNFTVTFSPLTAQMYTSSVTILHNAAGSASTVTLSGTGIFPNPVISAFFPVNGVVGTVVTINGTNFGTTQGASTITFGTATAIPSSWSNTQIRVAVPPSPSGSMLISITVNGVSGSSISPFTIDTPPTLLTGLVAYYPFNGNAIDESGNGKNGIVNGAALTTDRFGNSGKAYSFNGISNSIALGSWFNYSVFTISMWVKAGQQIGHAVIIDNSHSSTYNWVCQAITDYATNGYSFETTPTFFLPTDAWAHLTLQSDGGTIKAYINGQLTSQSAYGITYAGTPSLNLGYWIVDNARFWKGSLDDIRIYNRVLSDTEVSQLYLSEKPTAPQIASFTPGHGPVGTSVTINGTNFGATQGTSTIKFGAFTAAVASWSDTQLIVPVPNGVSGSVVLTITVNGATTTAPSQFTVDMVIPSVAIPIMGGTFQMGSATGLADQQPVHSVSLSSFFIDQYEISYEKWTEVRNWALTHGYTDLVAGQNGYNPNGTNNPVTMVTWNDIVKWCNARSEKDGLTPVYYMSNALTTVYRTGQTTITVDAVQWGANGYRLPTEAEWEFAARGGTKSNNYTYSGSNTLGDVAWYASNGGATTHPIGQKAVNELGIYDMSGNAWEWCWDWYGAYTSAAQTNPKGAPSGSLRVIRGGSFGFTEDICRSVYHFKYDPLNNYLDLGFRCAQSSIVSISGIAPSTGSPGSSVTISGIN